MRHLQSRTATSTPEDIADEYLYGLVPPSERPNRHQLEIAVRYHSEHHAVVTIIDRYVQDDSLSATCDRITLQRQNGLWLPVRHEKAWQGRGHIGWTTKPTS